VSPYKVTLLEHAGKKLDKLAFVGAFSECMAFVEALNLIKPGQAVGSLTMQRVTAPYTCSVARQDGHGATFIFKSKGGDYTAELGFAD
jgi:hypothetical protein